MMQVWNLLNVRAFSSGHSAFYHLGRSQAFLLILLAIVVGQVLIVTFGGDAFSVRPLTLGQWIAVLAGSSLVLWVGEAIRLFTRRKSR